MINVLLEIMESTANMLRGMTLDPAIPLHANVAMSSRIVELEAAVELAMKSDEWMDAATLPQIGGDYRSDDVLGCWPNGEMMVVYYSPCGGWHDSEGGDPCVTVPFHWQPLPEPLTAEAVRP